MYYLNYPASVDPTQLIGRVMGPDNEGAMYEVVTARRLHRKGRCVRAGLMPLYGARLIEVMQARESDEHGQPVVPEHMRTSDE